MKNKTTYFEFDYLFKLMIIGDGGVGKTSLIKAFVNDQFSSVLETTKDYDFRIRSNIIIDDKNFKIQIWDTFIERFRQYKRPYRGAHGILMLYDCTDRLSFNNIRNWYGEIERYACEKVRVILVATKIDIPETTRNDLFVSKEEGQAVADFLNIPFIEISSKNHINIENCLLTLVREIYEFRFKDEPPPNFLKIELNNNKKDKCIIN